MSFKSELETQIIECLISRQLKYIRKLLSNHSEKGIKLYQKSYKRWMTEFDIKYEVALLLLEKNPNIIIAIEKYMIKDVKLLEKYEKENDLFSKFMLLRCI